MRAVDGQAEESFHWQLLKGVVGHPAVYIAGLALLAGLTCRLMDGVTALIGLPLAGLLLLQGLLDIRYGLLFDRVNLILACSAVIPVWTGLITGTESLLGACFGSGFLWLLRLITHNGIGFGDVKFAGAIGLWLGWPAIVPGLGGAFLLGGMTGIYLLLRGRTLKTRLPFGPFLGIGAYWGFLFGTRFCQWYGDWL